MNQRTSSATEPSIFVKLFASLQKCVHGPREKQSHPLYHVYKAHDLLEACARDINDEGGFEAKHAEMPAYTVGCVRLAEAALEIMGAAESHDWPLAEAIEELARRRIEQGSQRPPEEPTS